MHTPTFSLKCGIFQHAHTNTHIKCAPPVLMLKFWLKKCALYVGIYGKIFFASAPWPLPWVSACTLSPLVTSQAVNCASLLRKGFRYQRQRSKPNTTSLFMKVCRKHFFHRKVTAGREHCLSWYFLTIYVNWFLIHKHNAQNSKITD